MLLYSEALLQIYQINVAPSSGSYTFQKAWDTEGHGVLLLESIGFHKRGVSVACVTKAVHSCFWFTRMKTENKEFPSVRVSRRPVSEELFDM